MVETRVVHRDEPGGLFIGTSMFLLALMNSAPAELLHPLTYAALQPSLAMRGCQALHRAHFGWLVMLLPQQRTNCIQPRTYATHASQATHATSRSCSNAAAIAKKNAGANASVGIPFQKSHYFFQRKCRLT